MLQNYQAVATEALQEPICRGNLVHSVGRQEPPVFSNEGGGVCGRAQGSAWHLVSGTHAGVAGGGLPQYVWARLLCVAAIPYPFFARHSHLELLLVLMTP
jgi:hypothetical protein